MLKDFMIFSGNSNPELAKTIAKNLNVKLGKICADTFSDGETQIKINENIRGKDCFVIQPTCPPVNESLMELLLITDAMKRASAHSITAVIPYYGYGRQDRKSSPRVPISAKLVANLITVAGATRVLTLDLHAGQIQGFFDIPVDNLYATPVFFKHFKHEYYAKKVCIVSPDAGGVERARAFAKRLHATLAIIDKRRPAPNQLDVMHVIGDVKNKTIIILDDIVDTAGTLIKVAKVLREQGANKVIAACTHGVLSGDAIERVENSQIEELVLTDSIPLRKNNKKIILLSIGKLLADAIKRIYHQESLSELFV